MEIDTLTSSFLGLRDKLHHIALSYLRSDEDAKDALQDTWLRLRCKGDFQMSSEAKNKLVAVLRNICIDHLRKSKPIPMDIAQHTTLVSEIEEEDIKHLERLLQNRLTPLQRQIFDLVAHEGLDYEQIAENLSMSVEAVRMNMSRTRKKIRENYKLLNR